MSSNSSGRPATSPRCSGSRRAGSGSGAARSSSSPAGRAPGRCRLPHLRVLRQRRRHRRSPARRPAAAPGPGPTTTSGCEPADFAGFPDGAVALLQRGTCPFRVKVDNALGRGGPAAVIFNEGQADRTDVPAGTLGGPGVELPVVAASFEAGRRLAEAGPGRLRVRTDTESSGTPTSNVLVELPGADPGRVVMAGGHLDSVTAGPGINDNASGSATLLEIARRWPAPRPTPSGSRGGRRGAWPARVQALCRRPQPRRAGPDRPLPQPRHGRLPQLPAPGLRRRRRGLPAGSG